MWYKLLFSFVLAILASTQAFATNQNEHIYLLIGQSNMAGDSGIGAQDLVNHPRVRMLAYDDSNGKVWNTWHNFDQAPMHQVWTGVCPGNTFGRLMADANPGVTIRLVPLAVSGAPIEMFQKNVNRNDGGSFFLPPSNDWSGGYPWMQARIDAALSSTDGVIKGIIFIQGESNSGQAAWPAKAAGVINDLKNDYGTGNIPVLIGELYSPTFDFHNDQLIPQMRNQINNAHIISSAGLAGSGDNVHFSRQSFRDYGYRLADKMKELNSGTDNLIGTKRFKDGWQGFYFQSTSPDDWSVVLSGPFMPTWGSQQWEIESVGDDLYRIRNIWTGDSLGAGDLNEWNELYTSPTNEGWFSQEWYIEPVGDEFRLKNLWTGLYITSPEFPWEPMRQAELRTNWGSQRFSIEAP